MNTANRLLCLVAGVLGCSAGVARGQVVISQIYGGGGNSTATYKQDFVELFNRGTSAETMTNWSVQYQTQGTNTWTVFATVTAILQPGQYYLIGGFIPASPIGTDLPTPDQSNAAAVNINATDGKVVLVDSSATLPSGCPAMFVDLVGFGTTSVACSEGANASKTGTSNAKSFLRVQGGCQDTNNNLSDFAVANVNPRNSASPTLDCGSTVTGSCCAPIGDCTSTTQTGCAAGSVWTLGGMCMPNPCAATTGACCFGSGSCSNVTPSSCSMSSGSFQGLGMACPAMCAGLVTACCNDSNGACTMNFALGCPAGTTAAGAGTACATAMCPQPMGACCSDNLSALSCTFEPADQCSPLHNFLGAGSTCTPSPCIPPQVVISQVYGGGGNSGSVLTNDFIEIFNRGTVAQSLDGWSVQYGSATGTTWQMTRLTGVTLQPGQYYLVQEDAGGGGTTALPTPDATGTISMAAGAGKIALVRTTTGIVGGTSCPRNAGSVVDFVGYGTTADCSEGTGPTPNASATNAVFRAMGGCQDTGDNTADFATGTAAPRNTSSPLNGCGGGPVGICCDDATGACTVLTTGSCGAGTTQGTGTTCQSGTPSSSCPVAGVCCDGASCSIRYGATCASGTPTAGSNCSPGPCGAGACCSGATCVMVADAAACTALNPASVPPGANTHFTALGQACNAAGNNTMPCCRADFNHTGTVSIQDLFDFLAGWFAKTPQADINLATGAPPCTDVPSCNSATGVTVQDLFDYLGLWFGAPHDPAPCP